MDHHIREYFSQSSDIGARGNFHKVIVLHEGHKMDWPTASKLVPSMCKGWYELTQLTPQDRIDFTRDFWLAKLPYHPGLDVFLERFFDSLDDIHLMITQQKFEDPHEAQLVYSLKQGGGFFRGFLSAGENDLLNLQKNFSDFILPNDYLAFLSIHNGFCKATDCTGITRTTLMKETYERFQELLQQEEAITTNKGTPVNPKTLIPFYESFGMPFLQCFWAEWYPQDEMGNVYYSSTTKTISDVDSPSSDSMAFPTFLEWLMFYMERFA